MAGRMKDSDRDVYGTFVVVVMNAVRRAQRSEHLMGSMEAEIVRQVRDTLVELDPHADKIRKAHVNVSS